jgi:hypothetical protein
MTNVILSRKRTIQVSTGGTAGVIDTTPPVTLKTMPTLGGALTRLDKLTDVNANGEINGATLVYDSDNDTYFVKKLDLADTVGYLDGGTF